MVGNHDDTAGAMSGSSMFRNPASAHGDRELPEIAANGTSVTTVGLTRSGTSMAAPAAAGAVALIQHRDVTLKSWPEGCRAIMLAAAERNIAGNTWWQDVVGSVDAADGTGAVDVLEAANITAQRCARNAAGTRRGWDVGTLRSRDIGANRRTTFSHFVTVPRFVLGPGKVKVALAWDSKITMFPPFPFPLRVHSSHQQGLLDEEANRQCTKRSASSRRAALARMAHTSGLGMPSQGARATITLACRARTRCQVSDLTHRVPGE